MICMFFGDLFFYCSIEPIFLHAYFIKGFFSLYTPLEL